MKSECSGSDCAASGRSLGSIAREFRLLFGNCPRAHDTFCRRLNYVKPGAVFVWEEEEAGIRRWTDHIRYSRGWFHSGPTEAFKLTAPRVASTCPVRM